MPEIRYKGQIFSGAASYGEADDVSVNDGSGQIENAQTIFNRILGDFATIESSTIASKAYAVDDLLVLNGYLYCVTTAIPSGGTITAGTNVTVTNVGDEVRKRDIIDCVDIPISAGTGNVGTVTNAKITSDHKVVGYNIVFGDPSKITTTTNVTTSNGQALINTTCTGATTATFQLAIPR